MLPIKMIDNNKIVNSNEKDSFFYSLLPSDIEHLSISELSNTFISWEQELNSLPLTIQKEQKKSWIKKFSAQKESAFLKFYWVNEKSYLNTNLPSPDLFQIESSPCSQVLEGIFGIKDFLSNVVIMEDYCICNNKYYQFVKIEKFPKNLDFSSFQMLGDYFVCLQKLDRKESKIILEQKRRINNSKNSDYFRNLTSDHAEREAESALEDIETDRSNLFKVEAWFVVSGLNLEEARKESIDLVQSLSKIDTKSFIETVGVTTSLYNFIPGVFPDFLRENIVPTDYAVNLLPLKRDYIHDKGILFKSESLYDIYFNLFDEKSPNYNLLVTGTTGGGKSHFTQKIIHHALSDGCKAIVIEKGNSFEKLLNYHGGQYLDGAFNPFEFQDPLYLKELIVSVIPPSEISFKDHGKIKREIESIIALKKAHNFKDLIYELERKIPEISLYFEDFFPYITDTILTPAQFTYVNSEAFPESIHAPLMIYLTQKMKSLSGRRIFCFDEIWSQLKSCETYLSEYFRLGRKRGISNIAISQNFSDFTDPDNKAGAVIAKQCFFKVFFGQDQTPNEFLSENDVQSIKSLQTVRGNYSQFYLKSSKHKKICQDFATTFEYELFTSHGDDNNEFKNFEKKYQELCSYPELIHKWVQFRHEFLSFIQNEDQHD